MQGTGLAAAVLQRLPLDTLFVTDYDPAIVENAKFNVTANTPPATFPVQPMDLSQVAVPPPSATVSFFPLDVVKDQAWPPVGASALDSAALKSLDFLYATDIIYQNSVTDGLFQLLRTIYSTQRPPIFFLVLDRRIEYERDGDGVAEKTYDHFLKLVGDFHVSHPFVTAEQIPIDFKQSFTYRRTDEAELWKFTKK